MPLEIFGSQFYAECLFAPSTPINIQLSLHLEGSPNTDLGPEITGGGYVRATISTATAQNNWNLPSGSTREVTNATEITFPTSTANWGRIFAVGFWKPNSSGTQTRFDWQFLTNPITVGSNETLSISPTRFSYQIG
jgi:hypothetical protein